jgi:hypothetical protein
VTDILLLISAYACIYCHPLTSTHLIELPLIVLNAAETAMVAS